MRYSGIVYRPPSEGRSLIVQATIGCSHNKCTFCDMYKDKVFQVRKVEDILQDFREVRSYYPYVRRIFLADGDALIMKTEQLVQILEHIQAILLHQPKIKPHQYRQLLHHLLIP